VRDAIDVLIAVHIADITSGRSLDDIDSYSSTSIREVINTEVAEKRKLLYQAISNLDKNTDLNGEPLLDDILKQQKQSSRFGRFSTTNTLGSNVTELNQGAAVSSVKIMSDLVSKRLFSPRNMRLADILARHDIPVKFDNLPGREVARAIELKDGGTVIVIDQANAAAVSNQFLADTILHEIIHACTVKAINSPVTDIEK
jgi:hypothetical protein